MRAVIYTRVSAEEQLDGFSLDSQLRACRDYCRSKDWPIVAEFIEEGKSAHTENLSKRPKFKEAIALLTSHGADVLVVHKLDRFSRSLRVSLETLERFARADVSFVSVAEGTDYTTPTGKFFLHMLGALAQLFSDNLSTEVKKGKQERELQGLSNGRLPFGTTKARPDDPQSPPVADPTTYPGLLMAFQAAARGQSDREVARLLNQNGYLTLERKPFTRSSVATFLVNRFYLGELGNGIKAQHEPLIDPAIFQAAQEARERNRIGRKGLAAKRGYYSLSGILRCGHCLEAGRDGRVYIHRPHNGPPTVYCRARREGTAHCLQDVAYLRVYEVQVSEYLHRLRVPADYREVFLAQLEREEKQDEPDPRPRLERELARLKDLYRWGDIAPEDYAAERNTIREKLRAVKPVVPAIHRLEGVVELLRDAPAAWDNGGQQERHELALALFQTITIKGLEVIACHPQPSIIPFFSAFNCTPD